jgi:hypothetical protein
MSFPSEVNLALLNLGGGEIILILILLFVVAVAAAGFLGLIYLIIRAASRPTATPPSLPQATVIQDQQRRDGEQVKLLAIFHFVFAGLALVGMGFLGLHYVVMHTVFSNPEMWKSHQDAMPPRELLDAFVWFYLFMGVLLLIGLALNVLSGVFLWQKRNRIFSLVIGGLNCLQIPFGTVLGIFTILVLSRDSVRQLYSQDAGKTA